MKTPFKIEDKKQYLAQITAVGTPITTTGPLLHICLRQWMVLTEYVNSGTPEYEHHIKNRAETFSLWEHNKNELHITTINVHNQFPVVINIDRYCSLRAQ